MKSCGKTLVSVLFVLSLHPVSAQVKGDVYSIQALKFRWMENQCIDSLALLLHPKLRYIHSNGWIECRDEVLENIRTQKLIYRRVEIESAQVRHRGKKAIVNGSGVFHVTLDGREMAIPLSYVEHYIKSPEGWQLIYRKSQKKTD